MFPRKQVTRDGIIEEPFLLFRRVWKPNREYERVLELKIFDRLQLLNYTAVPDRRKCNSKEFVVVVHVRADDQLGRNRWRETYGNPRLMQKFKYTLIFSVGLPYSAKQQEGLKKESRLNGDILQANYFDSYRNLTYKQLAELRYLASSCQSVKAIVKLDDDVGWNVKKAAQFIKDDLETNEIYCARRIEKEEWSLSTYPTHCAGMMYITTLATIKRMLDVVYLQKFFWARDEMIA
ncbi:N-acetyllactosaminide 3-alpha-galactosyltransferase [Ancylostoma ceylanicum]|uniref:Hexosyltransferase n=1 Tax=Ancylostoma ceylanicum TaxID=53326 RepID=A0A0D6LHD8_9BILA|nr:N-acetyllactosaminide 3-alpha-galactosyltransferase [Ancylostoma ceylanicum]